MPVKKSAAGTRKSKKPATRKAGAARKAAAPKAKGKAKTKAKRPTARKAPAKSPKKPAKSQQKPARAKPTKASRVAGKTRRGAKTVAKRKATATRSSAKSVRTRTKAVPAARKTATRKATVKPAPKPASKPASKPTRTARRPAATPRRAKRPPKVVAVPSRARAVVEVAEDDEGYEPDSRHDLLLGPRNVQPYIQRRGETYMSSEQLGHFQTILTSWKRDLMEEVDRTVTHMKDEAANPPDPNDRATLESEFALELRTRDRERKLIRKIEEAIKRIEDGSYGYCLETGEPIGVKRLEARPVATLCIEAQERRERRERQYGDRDDWYR
jgi:DnaK suppressor protein